MSVLSKYLVTATMFVSWSAFAGLAGDVNVEIDFENKVASGLPITARFSDNPDETIGCGVRHTLVETGINSSAFCQAALGPEPEDRIVCNTFNAEFADKIADLNHYSFIRFFWEWNEEFEFDECTAIRFTTQSHHIPEALDPNPKDKKD